MRILVIRSTTVYELETPAGIRISNLLRTWRDLGDEVTLCHYVNAAADEKALKESGIRYVFVPITMRLLKCLQYVERYLGRLFPQTLSCLIRNFIMFRFVRRKFTVGDFDCIVTSVPDFGSLILARNVASYLKIPFVTDFRDLPDEFDLEHKTASMTALVKEVSKVLAEATLINVVSPLWIDAMVKRYGVDRSKVFVSMNGYDGFFPEMSMYKGMPQPTFDIFYAGAIYVGRDKTFKLLFSALDLLASEGVDVSRVRVRIAGPGIPEGFPGDYKSATLFEYIGKLPRKQVLLEESKASVLLNLASPEAPGVVPSKIFEYAKMRRPILAIPSKTDVLAQLVNNTKIGICCESVEEIAVYLKKLMALWMDSGFVDDPQVNYELMATYSRSYQAKVFRSELKKGLEK